MRKAIHGPTLSQELGSLASLYRTVLWMIGRKIQYGQVWPDEVYKASPPATHVSPEAEVRSRELVGTK